MSGKIMIKRIIVAGIACLALVSCASQSPITVSDETLARKIAEAAVVQREKCCDPQLSYSNERFISQPVRDKDGKWIVVVHKMVGGTGVFVPKSGRILTLSPSGKVLCYKTIPDGPGRIGNTGYDY